MSLGKQMIERLRLLAADGPAAAQAETGAEGATVLSVGAADERATLEVFDHDRYSVALRAIEVGAGPQGAGDARAYLSAHAAEIARRMSYLEEPLAVWELAGGEQMAQLRSSPPQREEATLSYWEVTLWSGERPGARMARYRWAPGMPDREAVAYPATFALVGRIVDSLAAALGTIDQ